MFAFILMVHFVHVLAFSWTNLLFKDQQICAGIRELVLQMNERDARWGAYLEGNGWLKSYLTGEQENNVKKESWRGKASTAFFFSSLWSCHPSWRAWLQIACWPEAADRWSCPPHSGSQKHLPNTRRWAQPLKCVQKWQKNVKVFFTADGYK